MGGWFAPRRARTEILRGLWERLTPAIPIKKALYQSARPRAESDGMFTGRFTSICPAFAIGFLGTAIRNQNIKHDDSWALAWMHC